MQKLNEAQRSAVTHREGPMLVLAGPGSGKTRVITERIGYLIQEAGVSPAEILVITFTKAAAVEMQQRYLKMQNSQAGGVRFGTFHAIFFMILKYSFHYSGENIIREQVKRDLLKKLLHSTDLEIQDENEFLADLEAEISRVKGERMNLSSYYSQLCSNEVFHDLFSGYQRELKRMRLIDFDDMLVQCYDLLVQQPETLKKWQQQFRYILIDEFQDICRIQYDVIRLLAKPENNLFIVGDDDQSIYGFRGARPDIMKQFLKDYNAKQCLLGINYRCAAPIVEAAGRVISHNRDRLPKEIRPAVRPAAAQGIRPAVRSAAVQEIRPAAVQRLEGDFYPEDQTMQMSAPCLEVKEFPNPSFENDMIRQKIMEYHRQGIAYQEMAVLFRTNTQARSLSVKLMEAGVPFILKERLPNLYEHWIVQDVMTYVKIAEGSRERGDILRIINRPKRYVHRNAFMDPYVDFEELKKFYEEKDWMIDRLEKLQYDLSMLAKMKPYAAVNFIRRGIGYDDYIREYADYRGMRPDGMYEILDELQEEAGQQDSFAAWRQHIREYQEELRKQAEKSYGKKNSEQADSISLITMHGSKGLEYECVFIPDANEGVTPHSKSVLNADMEEERRMFYVAMTRAKSHLHIYYVKERFNKSVEASRFVSELLEIAP